MVELKYSNQNRYIVVCIGCFLILSGTPNAEAQTPLVDKPLELIYSVNSNAEYFINGVAMAIDGDGDGNVDTLRLPSTIEVGPADVPASASLVQAYLYWGGSQVQPSQQVPGVPDDTITLTVPGGQASALSADICYGSDAGANTYDMFICRADISARIELAGGTIIGSFIIDNYAGYIADLGSNNASAALILIYSDISLPANQLIIFDGLQTFQTNAEQINIGGANLRNLGSSLAWYTMEGDTGGTGTESVSVEASPSGILEAISDPVNPPDNPMNHTVNTVDPPLIDTVSLDVDRFDFNLGGASTGNDISVSYSAGTDKWWLVVNVFSTQQTSAPLIIFNSSFESQ